MDDDARTLAEQATIGALMLKPDAIGVVERWLRRSDFGQRWLGDLYVRLRERYRAGEACDPESVGRGLAQDRRAPERLARLLDVVQTAPVRPEPVAYARIVLESGIRREVDGLGVVLRAGAMAAARQRWTPDRCGTPRLSSRDCCARHISGGLTRGVPRRPNLPRTKSGPSVLDLRLGADRYLQAQPPPAPGEVVDRERQLVGALIVRPAEAGAIGESLHPAWFVDDRWAAGFAAILDLAATQQPVDVVTVAWRVQELSAAFGSVPSPRDLLEAAEDALTTDPVRAAAAVSADLTVRTAESAAASLSAASHRPGLRIPDLLDTGRTLLAATVTASAGMSPRHPRGPATLGCPGACCERGRCCPVSGPAGAPPGARPPRAGGSLADVALMAMVAVPLIAGVSAARGVARVPHGRPA